MNTALSKSQDVQTWRHLYRAALFEANPGRLLGRIAEAERALVLRARELFAASGDNIEEEQALDDAMYALRALRGTVACRTRKEAAPGTDDLNLAA
jgi:hypothetical protein